PSLLRSALDTEFAADGGLTVGRHRRCNPLTYLPLADGARRMPDLALKRTRPQQCFRPGSIIEFGSEPPSRIALENRAISPGRVRNDRMLPVVQGVTTDHCRLRRIAETVLV